MSSMDPCQRALRIQVHHRAICESKWSVLTPSPHRLRPIKRWLSQNWTRQLLNFRLRPCFNKRSQLPPTRSVWRNFEFKWWLSIALTDPVLNRILMEIAGLLEHSGNRPCIELFLPVHLWWSFEFINLWNCRMDGAPYQALIHSWSAARIVRVLDLSSKQWTK